MSKHISCTTLTSAFKQPLKARVLVSEYQLVLDVSHKALSVQWWTRRLPSFEVPTVVTLYGDRLALWIVIAGRNLVSQVTVQLTVALDPAVVILVVAVDVLALDVCTAQHRVGTCGTIPKHTAAAAR